MDSLSNSRVEVLRSVFMSGQRGDAGRRKKKGGNDGQLSVAAVQGLLCHERRSCSEKQAPPEVVAGAVERAARKSQGDGRGRV
jgi:hypothetical protein